MATIPGASSGSGSVGEDVSRVCWDAAAVVRTLVPKTRPRVGSGLTNFLMSGI